MCFPVITSECTQRLPQTPACTQERNASNQEDRVEGEYTKGRTGNRVKVRNRTNTTGYLLTNTQSQQVASASGREHGQRSATRSGAAQSMASKAPPETRRQKRKNRPSKIYQSGSRGAPISTDVALHCKYRMETIL